MINNKCRLFFNDYDDKDKHFSYNKFKKDIYFSCYNLKFFFHGLNLLEKRGRIPYLKGAGGMERCRRDRS